jgi:hypothetical protein
MELRVGDTFYTTARGRIITVKSFDFELGFIKLLIDEWNNSVYEFAIEDVESWIEDKNMVKFNTEKELLVLKLKYE